MKGWELGSEFSITRGIAMALDTDYRLGFRNLMVSFPVYDVCLGAGSFGVNRAGGDISAPHVSHTVSSASIWNRWVDGAKEVCGSVIAIWLGRGEERIEGAMSLPSFMSARVSIGVWMNSVYC